MRGDRLGERVLHVGVDVHLHHAVAQRVLDLGLQRSRSPVEHEVERLGPVAQPQLRRGHALPLGEHLGLEHHVARLVDAVHVAERRGQQILAVLTGAECLDRLLEILGRGVELVVDLGFHAVLFTADHADLDLQDDLRGRRLLEQFLRDREVLVDRHGRAVPHVRLEQRVLARAHPLRRDVQQRPHVGVELVLRAVVGVQRDGDRVLLGDHMRELRQRHRAGHHVLDAETGAEFRAAGGELDDPVRPGVSEALERGVDGLRRGAVHGRERIRVLLGSAQHLGVGLGRGDGHRLSSQLCWRRPPVSQECLRCTAQPEDARQRACPSATRRARRADDQVVSTMR